MESLVAPPPPEWEMEVYGRLAVLSAHILVPCLTSSSVEEKGRWQGHARLAQDHAVSSPESQGCGRLPLRGGRNLELFLGQKSHAVRPPECPAANQEGLD